MAAVKRLAKVQRAAIPRRAVCQLAVVDLLNDLVRRNQKRLRYREAHLLRCFHVDTELEHARGLHWQVAGLFAAQDPTDIVGGPPKLVGRAEPIGHQRTLVNVEPERIDCGDPRLVCDRDEPSSVDRIHGTRTYNETRRILLCNRCKRGLNPLQAARMRRMRHDAVSRRNFLHRLPQRIETLEVRVEQHVDMLHPGRKLPQQLNPLSGHLGLECAEAGDVAAWAREVRHIAGPYRITDNHENDRQRGAGRPHRVHSRRPINHEDLGTAREKGSGFGFGDLETSSIPDHVNEDLAAGARVSLLEAFPEGVDPLEPFRVVVRHRHHQANASRALLRLLRQRGAARHHRGAHHHHSELAAIPRALHNPVPVSFALPR